MSPRTLQWHVCQHHGHSLARAGFCIHCRPVVAQTVAAPVAKRTEIRRTRGGRPRSTVLTTRERAIAEGLITGITQYGLAKQLGVTRAVVAMLVKRGRERIGVLSTQALLAHVWREKQARVA